MTSEATNAQQAHGTVSTERTRKHSTILVVAAFAAFLATFNETFLNVGFAPIMESLSVDVSTVQWLATAYMLGAAVMVPVSAFAYRSFPTRQLFCATTALLVIGSVIGALAPNFSVLLVGRIVQALWDWHAHPDRHEHHARGRATREAGHLHGHHGRNDHARPFIERYPCGCYLGVLRVVDAAVGVRRAFASVLLGGRDHPARYRTPHASEA